MANCLFTWELGGGVGHVTVLKPVVRALVGEGHRVFIAAQDLGRAKRCFRDMEVAYLQAPFKQGSLAYYDPPANFGQILCNVGFGEPMELAALVEAWQNLFEFVRPDLLVFNYSPMAMLAAWGTECRKALIGTGFEIPPDCHPTPKLRPWLPEDDDAIRETEERLLDRINALQRTNGRPPLDRLAQLFIDVDLSILATFRELDPYERAGPDQYLGCWPNQGGIRPPWPEGKGHKVFAYLRGSQALPDFFEILNRREIPSLICVDRVPQQTQRQFASATLQFYEEPLDLTYVGQECDLAILMGSHGTTASMLLSGKPALFLPNHLEQFLHARQAVKLGAGLVADRKNAQHMAEQLDILLSTDHFAIGASNFAVRYRPFDPSARIKQAVDKIASLVTLCSTSMAKASLPTSLNDTSPLRPEPF